MNTLVAANTDLRTVTEPLTFFQQLINAADEKYRQRLAEIVSNKAKLLALEPTINALATMGIEIATYQSITVMSEDFVMLSNDRSCSSYRLYQMLLILGFRVVNTLNFSESAFFAMENGAVKVGAFVDAKDLPTSSAGAA